MSRNLTGPGVGDGVQVFTAGVGIGDRSPKFSNPGVGFAIPPPYLSLSPAIFAYSSSKPANSYTVCVFWRVGVVDFVVFACALRATTKKALPPNIFF